MECIFCLTRNTIRTTRPLRQVTHTRQESTLRRTKTALRIPPHPSFAINNASTDHVIYNPPSSAPNEYHTPHIFLPKSDPRRRMHQLANQHLSSQSHTSHLSLAESQISQGSQGSQRLGPALRTPREKKYHLTEADVAEMRGLRESDPRAWTVAKLAEKFQCSSFFVALCTKSPTVQREREEQDAAVRARWGRGKREAREDRQTRKDLWGRVA